MEYEEKLAQLGKNYEKPIASMIQIIESFSKVYIDRTFSGRSVDFNAKLKTLSPAAEISCIFHENFSKELNKIKPLEDHTLDSVALLLRSKTVSVLIANER